MSVPRKYDIVVVGGGLAGICASIASARHGCRTVLVQDRPVLGGNSSSEIRVSPAGAAVDGRKESRESGIIEEMMTECWNNYVPPSFPWWDVVLWQWIKREQNLRLHLNTSFRDVKMEKKRIKRIICEQLGTEQTFCLEADVFVDCTGDGVLAAKSGALFRMGRESNKRHNETLAPEIADKKTMCPSIVFYTRDCGFPVFFKPPKWAVRFPDENSLPFRSHQYIRSGYWWLEYGGIGNVISDNEEIKEELLKILLGVWDHMKNRGNHGVQNFVLDWIGQIPGKRESRRIVGDHILTQQDIESAMLFSDRVAYGGWPIDLHPPEGIYSRGWPCEQKYLSAPYSIPLRSLYSRNIENLFMAGRDISVTHVALGSTRIQMTGAVEGQAVGTAAALCKKYKTTPRVVGKKHILELQQQLLKDDCYLINLKNEDPGDIARLASVNASSSRKLAVMDGYKVALLNRPLAQIFPLSGGLINEIGLYMQSSKNEPTHLSLLLRKAEHIFDFNSTDEIMEISAVMRPKKSGWIGFPVMKELPSGLYGIYLPAVEGIGWFYSREELPGLQRAFFNRQVKKWGTIRGDGCIRINPGQTPFRAENVINGVSRAERWPNIWISDPDRGFPQCLDLKFGKTIRFNRVHLTFNTNQSNYYSFSYIDAVDKDWGQWLPPICKTPEVVRDYSLWYWTGKSWVKIIEEKGNYHRHRRHYFKQISASSLRLKISATNGARSAMVYEIRIYLDRNKINSQAN